MTLLAAFQVLLYRYTGQEDVAVGSPIANRRRPEIEGLIGFFVNTLVLRADLSGNPSFRELLSRVRDICVAADANQDLPFEKLVQELQPERDQSRNPLFQVMFVLQNATSPFSGIPGLRIEPLELATTRSPFDLSLFLREREGKYIGYIEYSTDLFDRDRIERMAGHFQTLLEAIVADPDQSIATLPILTEAERHQILVEWNDTAADYPKDKCIHQLFEEQVERTPDAIALEFEDKQITYRELNRRANQLAHYLISLGIGPEKLVGICVERSIEMVVGLLGILKAGGAYVPLDPTYPKERLRFMLEDSQVSVLLTQETLVEDRGWRIEDGDPRSSILDPRLQSSLPRSRLAGNCAGKHENLSPALKADNLAYVIYTSGSTGKPKGVQIEHRSVVNCLHSLGEQLGFTEHDVLLAVTTISFDISALELFLPLVVGGKVVVAGRDQAVDGGELSRRLRDVSATAMQATPSTWRLLMDAGWKGSPGFKILCGGEAMPRELTEALLTSGKLWNLYGPTETTIWSMAHKVESAEGSVPIGRPLANTKIYMLDSRLQPVPIGVHGDLYMGGDGLARGYWNNPELTAERFIPNPFSDEAHARLYRTGDRARYRSDGTIEFLGRTDNQVKIRGHRIELGEIESVLMQHSAVNQTVVVAFDEFASDSDNPQSKIENSKSLAAYVVPVQSSAPAVIELRRFLQEKLPDHMVPSSFVFLNALPLTANGKLDRNALPPPDGERPLLDHGFVEPRTEIEELVAQIWRDVLKLDKIGIHDNFFDLGGHSLLATRVIANLQEVFSKDVPLHVLFDAPTIAELAVELEEIVRQGHAPELPPIMQAPRNGPLPLSMNQEHLWYVDQMMPGTHFFNMPYVYRLSGELNVEALEKALSEIIRRHEALRTVFDEVDGKLVQIIKDGSTIQLPTEDLRRGTPHDLSQQAAVLLLEEREQPFDLATGPLFRIRLLRLTDRESFLVVTMHHIISDQWSMQVFDREMVNIYEAYSQGRHSPFGGLPFQFGDHAVWEKGLLKSGLLDRQWEYWKQQLSGPLLELEFTKSPARNKELSFRTSRQPIELDETLFGGIKALARRESCTPFMIILAALNLVLYALTGQEDIRIGTLVANRRRREAESMIGHLLNTVVLRTKLSPNLSCGQLLRQVREITLAAYAHQELPFEQLARVLETETKIKRGSLFQVLLSYHNADFQPVNLPGLTFASLGWQLPVSEPEVMLTACDLIVNIRETSTKLTGSVNYKTDTFDKNIVASMTERFAAVLKHMVIDTGERDSLTPDSVGA